MSSIQKWFKSTKSDLTFPSIFLMLLFGAFIAHFDDRMHWYQSWIYVGCMASAFIGLLLSRSKLVIALALIMQIAACWTIMPDAMNHWFFTVFISLTLFLGLIINSFGSKANEPEAWFHQCLPVLKLLVLLLYLFAVFHKINSDFFDPYLSCAVYFFQSAFKLPLFINGETSLTIPMRYLIIYLTFILEAGIPILLIFRRTWFLGIIFGVFFHMMTSLFMRNFPTLMFILYALFIPNDVRRSLIQQCEGAVRRMTGNKVGLIRAIQLQAVFWTLWASGIMYQIDVLGIRRLSDQSGLWLYLRSWSVFALIVFVGIVVLLVQKRTYLHMELKRIPMNARILYIVPILFFINCLSPYMGLKTHTSLSMWSNLVTSNGRSNHFLVPQSSLKMFSFLDDFVVIKETNIPQWHQRYILQGQQPSYLMMKRDLQALIREGAKHVFVRYIRNGREYVFQQEDQPNILDQKEHYWVRKFIRIKDCYPNNLGICSW